MSANVYLRALELTDSQRIYAWHNNPDLYATLIGTFHPVSSSTVENWIKNKSSYSEKEINFAICLTQTSEHIGNMYLRDIDYINRNAYLGAFIGSPDNRGKGYASEALLMVVDYAFYTLGLERLFLYAFADNKPAIQHLEKCGFVIEGKMRKHVFKNGAFKDVLIMGRCKANPDTGTEL